MNWIDLLGNGKVKPPGGESLTFPSTGGKYLIKLKWQESKLHDYVTLDEAEVNDLTDRPKCSFGVNRTTWVQKYWKGKINWGDWGGEESIHDVNEVLNRRIISYQNKIVEDTFWGSMGRPGKVGKQSRIGQREYFEKTWTCVCSCKERLLFGGLKIKCRWYSIKKHDTKRSFEDYSSQDRDLEWNVVESSFDQLTNAEANDCYHRINSVP